ncbi:MAG: hypothetical protein IPI45_12325 [Saprospiraceae bacterium]|nr:hypothetical protein [Saprospiraceae bacterium]MBK7738551.1 hypothetical protein [Saprospiraceae bacterium]MBK7912877.1 hypothetical protein [Saprospiraceae bacterium]
MNKFNWLILADLIKLMQTQTILVKSFLWALFLVIAAISSWEFYLRKSGYNISYDDGKEFWAHQRRKVYQPKDKTTVFIGSSRIKYDLDAETWFQETGEIPVQLAHVGSTPLPVLQDLANDENFKGKLILDITEKLFFNFGPNPYKRPQAGLSYLVDETYAQKMSFYIDQALQSYWVFLDKENFTLNPLIDKLPIPRRKDVFVLPVFPREFERVNLHRQSYMTDRFAADTAETKVVQNIWKLYGDMGKKKPPPTAFQIDSLLGIVKTCVDKLKSRGVEMVITRTPSTGDEWNEEAIIFPRDKFWKRILDTTQLKGIHFYDYPELTSLRCPEYSHLDLAGGKVFTKKLCDVLRQDCGWKFNMQF